MRPLRIFFSKDNSIVKSHLMSLLKACGVGLMAQFPELRWSAQENGRLCWKFGASKKIAHFCDPLKRHFVRGRPFLLYRIALL